MSIIVYWIKNTMSGKLTPEAEIFGDLELREALAFANRRRQDGMRHVSISSENPDNVTKPGVDSIENGMTPDGQEYTWKKRRE
jgi:hypothetical protein